MIPMSKRNKIFVCVLLLVYVIALVVFHVTYDYTIYWEEEIPLIIRYSLVYIVIGLILYYSLRRKAFDRKTFSNLSIKGATKIVAYASAIKAFLCICPFFFDMYFYSIVPLIQTAAWIAISAFFFTLYKNMK